MPRKRFIYNTIVLDELSNVDSPAQEPAKALIIKRNIEKAKTKTEDGKQFPMKDFAYTPDKNKPSTWKLRLTSTPGGEPDQRIVGAAAAALGPGYRGNKVQLPSSAVSAVKSKVRAAWKQANPDKSSDDMPSGIKKGDNMPNVTDEKYNAAIEKVKELETKLEQNTLFSKMNDEQRTFYNGLDDSGKESFLKMTNEKKNTEIEKVKKSEETVELDGQTIKKSIVGESVFNILKSQSAEMERIKKDNEEVLKKQEQVEFQKKASERFKCLPGNSETHGEVLSAIDKMDDSVKKTINEMLNSGEEAMKKNGTFKTFGDDRETVIEKKDIKKDGGTEEILRKKYDKK